MKTSKLPRKILLQLEIQKGTNGRWAVKKLRELMKGYITVKESSEPSEYQGSFLYAHTVTKLMNAIGIGP